MTRPYLRHRDLAVHVCRRLAKLDAAYDEFVGVSASAHTLAIGALVLELDNLIIQSLRAYALMVLRDAQKAGLSLIRGRAKVCLDDEFPTLVKIANSKSPSFGSIEYDVPRKDETKIRDPSRLRAVIQATTGSVPPNFQNALALNCSVFSELRDLRHFYAHRCENTFRTAMSKNAFYIRGAIRHPDQYVAEKLPGRSHPKFKDWVAETEAFFAVVS